MAPGGAEGSASGPYRVMVVDDSAVVRGLITRMLESDPLIKVVASVGNGQLAVTNLPRHNVEVVVLDIEMPVMDGMTALPKLLEIDPQLKVVMASTLTLKNADISLRALQLGAADYVPKPTSSRELSGGMDFKYELLGKVKVLGEARRRARGGRPATPASGAATGAPKPSAMPSGAFTLRKPGIERPDILAIGSSTGGPQALFTLLKGLYGKIDLPIVITQHMPSHFTTILAEHINRMSGWPCTEAKDGDVLRKGHVLVAPGNYHMTVKVKGVDKVVQLNQEAPENFCRPSVDPMFRSLVDVYGARILAVILTGMGQDGFKGGQVIVNKGGTVFAQDEKTSVVWGMPGAAAQGGICAAVAPLDELAQHITKFVVRGGA